MSSIEHCRCFIIGSGPAGYTAAIYASRANLHPILYEGMLPGGQLTTTAEVENFPGYPEGIRGMEMMDQLRAQAERFGADIRFGNVTAVDFSKRPYVATIDGEKQVTADTIIIATGAAAKYLGLEDEKKYAGKGVSACAVCDGFFYRKKTVAVVGGGDTACGDAIYLASICEKVYLLVRKHYLRASDIMQKRVLENPKIEVMFEHNVLGLSGEGKVQGATIVYRQGESDEKISEIAIDGIFLAIGHRPNTKLFSGKIDLDSEGYIKTKPNSTQTSVEGVYAAGDVADPIFQQAIVAAGSGCKAALEAEKFLMK